MSGQQPRTKGYGSVEKKLQLVYKPSESQELELPQIALILHTCNVAAMSNVQWHNFCFKIQNFRKTQNYWHSYSEKGLRVWLLVRVFVKEEEIMHKKEEHMEEKADTVTHEEEV